MRAEFAILAMVVLLQWPDFRLMAQDIRYFKLTDYSGHLESENLFRMNENQATGIATDIRDWSRQTALGLTTNGYVYHPYFFDFDLSSAISFSQNDSSRRQNYLLPDSLLETSSATMGLLWDMNLNVRLLKQKPYSIRFYYNRNNPLLQTGIEGSFTQLNENYGVNMQLQNALATNLSLDADRNSSSGATLDRVVDSIYDRLTFRANRSFKNNNRATFNYELMQMESRNGDPRRGIVEIVRLSHRTNLNSNWTFGGGKQFLFSENASYTWSNNPDVMNLTLAPNFVWRHTGKLDSNYRYNFVRIERPEVNLQSTNQSAAITLRYRPTARLNGHLDIGGDRSEEAQGFLENSYGGNANVNYTLPAFKTSQLNLSGGLGYQRRNRETSLTQILIFEEAHQLSGTVPITLNRDFVVAGSIVVRNEAGTQTFIENVDYRVTTIGAQTQIERLIGGSILNGEDISVDYAIDAGGSFGYALFNQNFSADLSLARYYRLYLRYSGSDQTVTEGISTNPLNSIRVIEAGTRADLPLRWQGLNVGAGASYAFQDEDINPFNRVNLDASAQAPLPYHLNLRINARYNLIDYLNSAEDQNQIGFNGNLEWNGWRNLALNLEGYFDRDIGGSILRSRTEAILRASWHYRRLSLSAETRYSQEAQGDFENDNLSLWLTVRRELF